MKNNLLYGVVSICSKNPIRKVPQKISLM